MIAFVLGDPVSGDNLNSLLVAFPSILIIKMSINGEGEREE
jgi:hypothetical protein